MGLLDVNAMNIALSAIVGPLLLLAAIDQARDLHLSEATQDAALALLNVYVKYVKPSQNSMV